MKRIIRIAVAAAIVALIALLLAGNKKKIARQTSSVAEAESTEVVSTYTVRQTPVCHDFTSNAAVQAVSELNFVSDVTGRVIKVFVDKGSRVSKGTPLLKIDSELIEADYKAAEAAYRSMKRDEERFTKSNEVGGVTDQQLEAIRTQVIAAESRLTMAKWKLDNSVVKSPMSGTVNMRFVEPGSLIAPNAPLFEIVDGSKVKLVCMIPESKLGLVKVGDKVSAIENGNPDKLFTGKVKSVGVKTDRGLNYPIEIIMDSNPDLHIGMYLKVQFKDNDMKDGILIPRKAIVGSAMAANVYLAVNGKAVRREVVLGDMFGNDIEIVDGLRDGDVIVLNGLMNIADGTNIRTVE